MRAASENKTTAASNIQKGASVQIVRFQPFGQRALGLRDAAVIEPIKKTGPVPAESKTLAGTHSGERNSNRWLQRPYLVNSFKSLGGCGSPKCALAPRNFLFFGAPPRLELP